MKNIICNLGYFLREVITIIRINPMSNVFSLLSTALIFFILAAVISGWWISSGVVEAVKSEAEVSVYFSEGLEAADTKRLTDLIRDIEGVREARLVSEEEAYLRMEQILGKEAKVLEYLAVNPFSPFIEVKIQIEDISSILGEFELLPNIEHIRDNREILDRISSIAGVLRVMGLLVVTAVGISTMVIISHIIRMGIYDNREQINTLRLMGASEAFIGFPFILEGLLLTLGGGIIASLLSVYTLRFVYAQMAGPLTFIPLPSGELLISQLVMLIMILSAALGISGSIFGLSSAKNV